MGSGIPVGQKLSIIDDEVGECELVRVKRKGVTQRAMTVIQK